MQCLSCTKGHRQRSVSIEIYPVQYGDELRAITLCLLCRFIRTRIPEALLFMASARRPAILVPYACSLPPRCDLATHTKRTSQIVAELRRALGGGDPGGVGSGAVRQLDQRCAGDFSRLDRRPGVAGPAHHPGVDRRRGMDDPQMVQRQ
ncbi:protein of unknown function [Thiomonas sp. Bio17B3]|nr:protein of unknown function [Thiomonas sp. Bio17B3]